MNDRVTAYIGRQAAFAQPILVELRRHIHAARPGIQEDIKWGMPAFLWNGRQIANMAGFKAHCALSFWHLERREDGDGRRAMGQFGRIATPDDLPDAASIATMVADAIALAETGAGASPAPAPKPAIAMPDDFAGALHAAGQQMAFDAMPPGARREYLEWITKAKQPATRARRIATAVAQVAEGKRLHWKYE